MPGKKIIIIGAGPGGLSAGMILAKKGFDVNIYEKQEIIGGRNGFIKAGDFKFDIGPTFFLMKDVLEDIFNICWRHLSGYVDLVEVDPMYRLDFKDKVLFPTTDKQRMVKELERVFPGSSNGYLRFRDNEDKKYKKLIPCLQVPYGKVSDYFSMRILKSLPYLDAHISLYDVLGRYFDNETQKICFTFQAKYIGMSPWEAPGTFSIISYIEHGGGIYHVTGGLNKLSEAMAKVIQEEKGQIHLGCEVDEIIVENGEAKGVKLKDGTIEKADYVIVNADFANAMTKLVGPEKRKKYNDRKLEKMKYSCSTFMLYLGLDKVYDHLDHHNIFFAEDYARNVKEISENKVISEDTSFYVHNPSKIDPTMAPDGKSAVYVLVPVGNLSKGIDWEGNKEKFRDKILGLLETRAGMKNLKEHIEELRVITPVDWRDKMDVHYGATFNLGHNIGQMLYFRPHNEFEEFKNCYLVGGGTHPGSGLPTIYESGRISAEMILKNEGMQLK